jgi:DNA segregation ATPase FtsK/SpoIIIE-like protein
MNTLASDDNDDHNCDPELLAQAIEIFRTEKQRSISLLQRRLHLGYTVASKLMDAITEHGLDGQQPF